ncbi:MAG: Uma2 family endonuclease [Acidobacteria bacterium]|nr:Uma2 family endonuclease [Acidobacteriota bacterium]
MPRATYDDIVKLPDFQIGELVDGELYATPRPALRHARLAVNLIVAIATTYDHIRIGPKGWHLLFEPEIHLGDDVFVPDLAGWRMERLASIPDTAWAETEPDWICEILSPSNGHYDRAVKMPAYARYGIPYAWIVDPVLRRIDTWMRDGREWRPTGNWPSTSPILAPPFDSVAIDRTQLWT